MKVGWPHPSPPKKYMPETVPSELSVLILTDTWYAARRSRVVSDATKFPLDAHVACSWTLPPNAATGLDELATLALATASSNVTLFAAQFAPRPELSFTGAKSTIVRLAKDGSCVTSSAGDEIDRKL